MTDTNIQSAIATQAHPWTDLGPQHFRLLRLAPLATDRHTGARPLRFVQLGQVERHTPEQSLLRLTLQLPGQRVRKEQNLLEVWADHRNKEVRFGADNGLQIEPLNRGLGRFVLAQGIIWAKRRWAHYQVEGGALAVKNTLSEDGRLRRDHFLRAQGFDVTYQDQQHSKARYSAAQVSELNSGWQTEKVQIVDLVDAAAMLQQADQHLREQDVSIRKLNERLALFTREDGSLRFTIACLVMFAVFQAGLLIWIATH